MNRLFLSLGLCILLPLSGYSQDFVDALRYSSLKIEGTARSGGMGNAFGALGGDFTAVGINPAGLGIYRTSEFAISPNFGMWETKANYLGSTATENDYKIGLGNVSYVGTIKSKSGGSTGLVSVNFGLGYNRLKDFNSMSLIEGHNAKASFLDYVADNANANDWSDFYEELAWKTDVLLYDTNTKVYWHDAMDAGYGQSQRKSINKRGALDEYTLGLGLNFSHRLYLGASLGIDDLYYHEYSTLEEYDDKGKIPFLNSFDFNTSLRTLGTGFNFKLGAIFKPINSLRLGASLSTPTFFSLKDRFSTFMNSSVTYQDNTTKTYEADSPLMDYDYELVTPWRATLSAALVLGKKGIISADYEFLDYSIAKFRNGGDGENFTSQNSDIREVYKPVSNLRLGGEYRLNDNFALRAGYEIYPSAYNGNAFGVNQPNAGRNYNILSAGLGYAYGSFSFDAAYRLSTFTEYNTLYPAPISSDYPAPEMAKMDNKSGKVLFTLGFRF
jgi:hypothetical protein